MRKHLFLSIVIFFSFSPYVVIGQTKVVLTPGHDGDIRLGHPHNVPIVTSDGDDVNISCDSVINNMDIVIRDQFGYVMHHSTQTIGPEETTLYVGSSSDVSERTTIDLYYDHKHLSGCFNK